MITAARLPDLATLIGWSEALTRSGLRAAIAAGLALALHFALFAVLARLTRLSVSTSDEIIVGRLHQASDHPVHLAVLETAYLKGLVVQVT